MTESNGNVKQSDFYKEMKELRQDISDLKVLLTKYSGDVGQGVVERSDLKKALAGLSDWKEKTDNRIDVLESKDTRYTATVAGVAAVVSTVVTAVVSLIIAFVS